MPKLKNKSSAKKRFSFTKSGKVKVKHGFKSHFLRNRSTDMKRNARGTKVLCDADAKLVKSYLRG